MASGEGATLETMAKHSLVCAMILAKLALKPPAGCWLRRAWQMEGWRGEGKKERKRDKTRHAVTYYTTLSKAAWSPETYFCCTGCPFKNLLQSISSLELLANVATCSRSYHLTHAKFFII